MTIDFITRLTRYYNTIGFVVYSRFKKWYNDRFKDKKMKFKKIHDLIV